jgi:hypothetical protein
MRCDFENIGDYLCVIERTSAQMGPVADLGGGGARGDRARKYLLFLENPV